MKQQSVSMDTAVVVTGRSRRTWWRRIADGSILRADHDERGRTMISWADVAPHICIPMNSEDLEFLIRADGGDADGQNDIGQLFSLAGKHEIAFFWLTQAAHNNHADAMQWLARYYLAGETVPKDENLALMWLAKSAARGGHIAREQMRTLRSIRALP